MSRIYYIPFFNAAIDRCFYLKASVAIAIVDIVAVNDVESEYYDIVKSLNYMAQSFHY